MIQKIRMHWKKSLIILTLVFIGLIIYKFFYSMNDLPTGEYLFSLSSPNEEYTLKSYLVNGGATVANCIRVELINNKTNKTKNIYWEYRIDKVEMEWIDNETVNINGKVLNIHKDKYDWRKNR